MQEVQLHQESGGMIAPDLSFWQIRPTYLCLQSAPCLKELTREEMYFVNVEYAKQKF